MPDAEEEVDEDGAELVEEAVEWEVDVEGEVGSAASDVEVNVDVDADDDVLSALPEAVDEGLTVIAAGALLPVHRISILDRDSARQGKTHVGKLRKLLW